MPESNEPFIGKFTDVLMVALTHKGRMRAEKEFRNCCTYKTLNRRGEEWIFWGEV